MWLHFGWQSVFWKRWNVFSGENFELLDICSLKAA